MANNYTPRRAAPSGDPAPRRSTSRDTGYPSSSRSYAPRETHYDPGNRPSAPWDSRYSSQHRSVRTTRPAPRQEEEDLYIRRRPVQTRRKRTKSGPPLLQGRAALPAARAPKSPGPAGGQTGALEGRAPRPTAQKKGGLGVRKMRKGLPTCRLTGGGGGGAPPTVRRPLWRHTGTAPLSGPHPPPALPSASIGQGTIPLCGGCRRCGGFR